MTQKGKPTKSTPRKKSKSSKVIDIYLGIGIFGVLVGVITIFIVYPKTVINVSTIFTYVFIFGIIINIAMLSLVLRKNKKGKTILSDLGIPFYTILNFAGGGTLFTGLMLMLNLAGRSAETYTEVHEFEGRDPLYRAGAYNGVIYTLKENKRPDEIELRWFELKDIRNISEMGFLQWEFSKGLFGIDIFISRGFVTDMEGSNYIEVPLLGDGFQD